MQLSFLQMQSQILSPMSTSFEVSELIPAQMNVQKRSEPVPFPKQADSDDSPLRMSKENWKEDS